MSTITDLLQTTLESEIPLSKAIGIYVAQVTDNSVTLMAPLENNINHKCTAFGGSLYSVAVLTGWSLIFTKLHKLKIKAHIVIQESSIKYRHPVINDIIAKCEITSEPNFNRFIQTFNKKNIARIQLNVVIAVTNEIAVEFKGKYVIHI